SIAVRAEQCDGAVAVAPGRRPLGLDGCGTRHRDAMRRHATVRGNDADVARVESASLKIRDDREISILVMARQPGGCALKYLRRIVRLEHHACLGLATH